MKMIYTSPDNGTQDKSCMAVVRARAVKCAVSSTKSVTLLNSCYFFPCEFNIKMLTIYTALTRFGIKER